MRRAHALQHIAAAAVCAVLSPSAALGASILFDWSSTTAGTAGGINATITSTITQGAFFTGVYAASDPSYVADFSSSHSILNYNDVSNLPGLIDSTFSFSSALPSGSRLIVLDVDLFPETAILAIDGTPPTLLAQIESILGEMSIFPNYNALTGELVSAGGAPGGINNVEASIFDVSGASSIQVGWRNGGTPSGIAVAIAIPVPEPSSLLLSALGLGLMAGWGRHGRHRAGRLPTPIRSPPSIGRTCS